MGLHATSRGPSVSPAAPRAHASPIATLAWPGCLASTEDSFTDRPARDRPCPSWSLLHPAHTARPRGARGRRGRASCGGEPPARGEGQAPPRGPAGALGDPGPLHRTCAQVRAPTLTTSSTGRADHRVLSKARESGWVLERSATTSWELGAWVASRAQGPGHPGSRQVAAAARCRAVEPGAGARSGTVASPGRAVLREPKGQGRPGPAPHSRWDRAEAPGPPGT